MTSANVLIFILLSCAARVSWGRELPPDVAPPLTEDRVYYRWQSTITGENLARKGRMDAATNDYFMSMEAGDTGRTSSLRWSGAWTRSIDSRGAGVSTTFAR